jgi:hypothetical protein
MTTRFGSGRRADGWALAAALLAIAGLSSSAAFGSSEEEQQAGWTGQLALSVNAQTGTTDTFAGSVDASTQRSWERDNVSARFNGVYGTTRKRNDDKNTQTTQNSQGIFGDWKHTIHERFFWITGSSVARDSTQDLDVRATLATGPGYRVWEAEAEPDKQHFDLSGGMGYRFEIYDGNTHSTVANNGDTDNFADVVVAADYKNLFFDDKIEYSHTLSARMPANDPSSYLLRTEIIVGIPLSEAWSFRTTFLAEYVANPGADEVNNTTTRTAVGLGYKF